MTELMTGAMSAWRPVCSSEQRTLSPRLSVNKNMSAWLLPLLAVTSHRGPGSVSVHLSRATARTAHAPCAALELRSLGLSKGGRKAAAAASPCHHCRVCIL